MAFALCWMPTCRCFMAFPPRRSTRRSSATPTFGGFLGVLRPRRILPVYAMAFLRTPFARSSLIDSSSQTTNIANVSLAKLRPLPFPLPPLAEQSRIVARVEELMRLCDALEAKARLEVTQHAQLVATLLGALATSTTPEALADPLHERWHRVATHFDLLLDRPEAVDGPGANHPATRSPRPPRPPRPPKRTRQRTSQKNPRRERPPHRRRHDQTRQTSATGCGG